MTQEELQKLLERDPVLFNQYMAELVTVQNQVIDNQTSAIQTLTGYLRAQYKADGIAPFWPELSQIEAKASATRKAWGEFAQRWDAIIRGGGPSYG